MADPRLSGLYDPQPRPVVIRDLVQRTRARFQTLGDAAAVELLEDALYTERKRLERAPADEEASARLEALARALVRGDRSAGEHAALELVGAWADEVHGRFDHRVYRFATRILPRALTGLLSSRPGRLRDWTRSGNSRVRVAGDVALLRTLAREATLILVPTHVSNLDSPLIGLALHLGGLPPFVYGAGLNLFSNPIVGWWMHRLGAYTVDRTKQARLYKQVLKDYSVRCLTTRHHSLFFPGGTRARSGEVEQRVKKGLLGTGIDAWQEMLAAGRPDSDVYVVPLTLSFQLVLEASTLIEDHLAEIGKQRYIITDDEFAQPRRLLAFANRVLDLDASVVTHFGAPLDCLGNPVSPDADERRAQSARRRRYVCAGDGTVERDAQRDRMYTDRLGEALVQAWPRYAWVMSTHLAAAAAWDCLVTAAGTTDPFRIVRTVAGKRAIRRHLLLARIEALLERVRQGVAKGRFHTAAPTTAGAVLDEALDRFARYHRTRALVQQGSDVVAEDAKLLLYYRNRLTFLDREGDG